MGNDLTPKIVKVGLNLTPTQDASGIADFSVARRLDFSSRISHLARAERDTL